MTDLINPFDFFEMSKDITYWFKSYQIDNTNAVNISIVDVELLYNIILKRFLYGDNAYDSNLGDRNFYKNYIGENKEFEMVMFKQSNNSGTLDASQDAKCIYALIVQKKKTGNIYKGATSENLKGMWLCVFCPRKVCEKKGCGSFSIWKVNTESIPNAKLSWYINPQSPGDVVDKYCFTTTFVDTSGTTVGDKVIIGIVGKKAYFSPKSFYLEGRHEDFLKKMPSLNGVNVVILQTNVTTLSEN